ncbi:MAG: bifunctional diaminohydroxyphosphoribosylaminopyrimidine deaminase/5-amino-6-(5-phosphoribosylamino)uracil reductase RibD [Thermodesulfobacteriota bacterium]|nr:bifunctional diaminohydroxyphosphoribosylaminopyrimidine deaminase/5-amino-6-(5-phosphoribosylamino)uracil reductase RibD [Thermodesulfobacteriota bacterium]
MAQTLTTQRFSTSMDEAYMRMALSLAEGGRGWTSPNPMVGAVVVKEGQVVGRGFHRAAGGPHAEIYALKEAGEGARGATLYVTLEPCNHTGRTPPCTEAILDSGIQRVVAGMRDPNPGVTGKGLDFLSSKGLDVCVGVCEKDCRRLNEFFIKYVTTGLPFVILKCASTLDGRIATRTGDSKWITNELSRQFVHGLRHAVDAIMVGIGTVVKDNPQLTTRLEGLKGSDPIRIVLDSRLSIPPEAKLLHLSSHSDTLLVTSPSILPQKKSLLERPGVRLLAVECHEGQIDLKALMKALGEMGITSLLIEGGSHVNGTAMRAGIVDKICMFFAPKICGGHDGVPICTGPGVEFMEKSMTLKDISVRRFQDDVMIQGYF